jgi:hypothetical protein
MPGLSPIGHWSTVRRWCDAVSERHHCCQLTSWNEKIGFLVGLDINSETNGRSIVSLYVPLPSAALSGTASSTLEIGS